MKFQASRVNRYGRTVAGPWRRTYPRALADARADIDPMRARISTWEITPSRGPSREIGASQFERGLDDYHAGISARNARGVW